MIEEKEIDLDNPIFTYYINVDGLLNNINENNDFQWLNLKFRVCKGWRSSVD